MNRRDCAPRDLAFAPLVPILTARGLSDAGLGRLLGMESTVSARRKVQRLKCGGLTIWEADLVATLIGHHPEAIWGVAWTEARTERDGADRALALLRKSLPMLAAHRDKHHQRWHVEWIRGLNAQQRHAERYAPELVLEVAA